MKLSKAARIILVGAPGVGKGTQAERMLNRYPQLSSISSGDLLRNNVRNKTTLGMQAEKLMKAGALVPDATILRLILNELIGRKWVVDTHTATDESASLGSETTADDDNTLFTPARYGINDEPDASYILDGFPRTAGQATQLDAVVPPNWVVHLDTPASIILDRIANRWVHAPSGRVYNTTFNPPKEPGKDDETGEPLTKRDDDKPEVWETRLKQFAETSDPLLEHYDKLGILWRVKGNSSDEISPQLFEAFAKRFCA